MLAVQESKYDYIINECFATDKELLSKWHISAPASVETCTVRTVMDLQKATNFVFYSLMEGNEIAGFFGTEIVNGNSFCTSFFLKPKFRHKKKEFWNEVVKKTGNTFLTAIHPKNERASAFLSKHGFIQESNEKYTLFKVNICQ